MNEKITDSDVALCYECRGSGPDVLLVHGFASSRRVWDPLVATLESAFRCWAVDLAGCGDTRIEADRRVSLDEHVAHLRAFARRHDIQPRAVIGHSMGGMLAVMLALADPTLTERLVLVSPAITGRYLRGANYLVSLPGVQWVMEMARPVWDMLQSEAIRPLLVTPPYLQPDVRERIREDFRRTQWGAAMSAMAGICAGDLSDRLAQVTQQTLVIVGGRDDMVPPSDARLAAERIPQARLIEIANCHHLPLDEAPDATLPEIERFVRGS
jgi:pimeloyl-ACP methyl ester carboxylesterase